jgi:GDP-4-dehydro-6-deoxy-D-mannose reductase
VPGLPLITGATGFAGGHLLDRLVAGGSGVHAWGHRGSARTESPGTTRRLDGHAAHPSVTWTAVDLLDRASVRDALAAADPSVIYHCAGFADVHHAWQAPAKALRVNVLGTHNLFEAARELSLDARVLVTGSALIYQPSLEALDEASPIGAATPYGVSKLAQEMTAATSATPSLLARPFNHAGPRQSPQYVTSAFAQQIADIEDGRQEPVIYVGNLDARRDITDVRDTVRAYEALAARGQPSRPYNVCSGRACSVRELLDILLSLSRVRVRVEVVAARLRPSDNPIILGSHARLTAETGWRPEIPIEQTLSDLLAYWRAARS